MSNNKCMVCHKNFKNFNGLSAHITKSHKEISPQYYYDTYIDTIKIHICPTCGKNTPFLSIGRGYAEYCNQTCANKDNDIIKIRHETLSNTYGHPFNRPEILKKCSETLYKRYGTTNSYQIDYVKAKAHSKEALLKHYNTLKKNNTFKVSKQEDDCYILLQ